MVMVLGLCVFVCVHVYVVLVFCRHKHFSTLRDLLNGLAPHWSKGELTTVLFMYKNK